MSICVFCSNKDIKDRLIIENNNAWAFPTNMPITEGHTLVCPKRCVSDVRDLTNEELKDIFFLIDKMTSALKNIYSSEGFNFAWNQGKLAGQSVPHLHFHIIPRKEGDTGLLGYDPRSMLYRTGDREPSSESEILKIVKKIKSGL
jgi:histidine triad (HIT) family protein